MNIDYWAESKTNMLSRIESLSSLEDALKLRASLERQITKYRKRISRRVAEDALDKQVTSEIDAEEPMPWTIEDKEKYQKFLAEERDLDPIAFEDPILKKNQADILLIKEMESYLGAVDEKIKSLHKHLS